jgi:hypothetical protein
VKIVKKERDPPLFTSKQLIKFKKILRNTTQVIVRHMICLQTDGRTWWNQYTPLQLRCGGYNYEDCFSLFFFFQNTNSFPSSSIPHSKISITTILNSQASVIKRSSTTFTTCHQNSVFTGYDVLITCFSSTKTKLILESFWTIRQKFFKNMKIMAKVCSVKNRKNLTNLFIV